MRETIKTDRKQSCYKKQEVDLNANVSHWLRNYCRVLTSSTWELAANTWMHECIFLPALSPLFYLFIYLWIYLSTRLTQWLFGAEFFSPVLVFSPSVLPSSPLVFAVGRSRLKLSKRQVEQVQHSNPPSLSRTFPTPHAPQRERDTQTHREREEGKQRHSGRQQGERRERCWLLVFFKMIHLTWQNIHRGYDVPAHNTETEGFLISLWTIIH